MYRLLCRYIWLCCCHSCLTNVFITENFIGSQGWEHVQMCLLRFSHSAIKRHFFVLQLTFQVFSLHLQESNLQQSARNTQHKQLMHGMIYWVPFILEVRDNIEAASNLCILGCVSDDIYPPTLFVCKRIKWDGVQLVPLNSHVNTIQLSMSDINQIMHYCILTYVKLVAHVDS